MKVSQEPQDFKPVTITLETFDELKDMNHLMYMALTNQAFCHDGYAHADLAHRVRKALSELSN